MQIRIRTTLGAIFGRMLIAAVVGAIFVLVAVDNAGLMKPTTTPAPSPAVSAQASPTPTLAPAAIAPVAAAPPRPGVVKAPPGSGMRDGGNYILGIYIPPPGR